MIGYVYLTHDVLKNKVYVGQHQSKEYDKTYFGSGTIISRIIKKRKDTLRNYVLDWCETKDALDESEIRWIAYFREEFGEENCYNIKNGGDGAYIRTSEIKKKTSNSKKGKYIGKKWYNNSIEEIILYPEDAEEYIKNGYVEGRLKSVMRKSADKHIGNKAWNKGKKGLYHTSEETKQKLSKISKGKPKSEETRQKMSEARKGRPKKKYYWRTPDGEIKIMDKSKINRYHPDWTLIRPVE